MATRTRSDNVPTTYIVNGATTSPKFGKAFAKGCGGKVSADPHYLLNGDVAMFGHPQLFGLLDRAKLQNRNWYYGDKAYFRRDTYYRITKNGYMQNGLTGDDNPSRWRKLGLTIQDWRKGSDILICPQSDVFFKLQAKTQAEWIKTTTDAIKKHTDRRIRVHHKNASKDTESVFKRQLVNAWAVVVHSSMAGVQAAIHGVPCFATDPNSTSASFGTTDLTAIETPVKPDNRLQMASILANNQWTISEINSGLAWEYIK